MTKAFLLTALLMTSTAFAGEIDPILASASGKRSASDLKVSAAQVEQVFTLLNKDMEAPNGAKNLQVKIIVVALGGSTDVSPSKQVIFAIYSENEMAEYVAAYDLGAAFSVESARRASGGVYEFTGKFHRWCGSEAVSTISINAVQVVNELKYLQGIEFEKNLLKSDIVVTGVKDTCE